MKIKAILYDHDGTLVDSELVHYEIWRDILKNYDVELTHEEYVRKYSGIPSEINAKLFTDNFTLTTTSPEQLSIAKTKATSLYLSKTPFPLMSGAYESINYFHAQGLKIGIVTGAGREGVDTTIKKHALKKYISTAVSGDDVKISKPAPDCYLLAAKNLAIHPSECLAIEDTVNGISAATAANIKCIGVSSSDTMRADFSNTTYVCDNLFDVMRWVAHTTKQQL